MHPDHATVARDDRTDAHTEGSDEDLLAAARVDDGQHNDGTSRPAVPDEVDGLRVDEGDLAHGDEDGVARPDGSDLLVDEGVPHGPADGAGDVVAIKTVGGAVEADEPTGDGGPVVEDIAVPARRVLSGSVELVDDPDDRR